MIRSFPFIDLHPAHKEVNDWSKGDGSIPKIGVSLLKSIQLLNDLGPLWNISHSFLGERCPDDVSSQIFHAEPFTEFDNSLLIGGRAEVSRLA